MRATVSAVGRALSMANISRSISADIRHWHDARSDELTDETASLGASTLKGSVVDCREVSGELPVLEEKLLCLISADVMGSFKRRYLYSSDPKELEMPRKSVAIETGPSRLRGSMALKWVSPSK